MTDKFCIDCRYSWKEIPSSAFQPPWYVCTHPQLSHRDLVTGAVHSELCKNLRKPGKDCGLDGLFWERKINE